MSFETAILLGAVEPANRAQLVLMRGSPHFFKVRTREIALALFWKVEPSLNY